MTGPETASPVQDLAQDLAEDVEPPHRQADVVAEDTLVEEVSIDGMCGVY